MNVILYFILAVLGILGMLGVAIVYWIFKEWVKDYKYKQSLKRIHEDIWGKEEE